MLGEALRTIYDTLILPSLCYCNGIWGSVNASNLRPLQVIQKRTRCRPSKGRRCIPDVDL